MVTYFLLRVELLLGGSDVGSLCEEYVFSISLLSDRVAIPSCAVLLIPTIPLQDRCGLGASGMEREGMAGLIEGNGNCSEDRADVMVGSIQRTSAAVLYVRWMWV